MLFQSAFSKCFAECFSRGAFLEEGLLSEFLVEMLFKQLSVVVSTSRAMQCNATQRDATSCIVQGPSLPQCTDQGPASSY